MSDKITLQGHDPVEPVAVRDLVLDKELAEEERGEEVEEGGHGRID